MDWLDQQTQSGASVREVIEELKRALLYYNDVSEQLPDKGFAARRALMTLARALGGES